MKKIFVFLAVLFSVSSAYAQGDQKFHFGLKAAPSLAWLSTDSKDIASDGTKLGFSYGLITEFNFADHYAFATGIDVVYRGGKLKSSSVVSLPGVATTTIISSQNSTLEYIDIPLTLKLKTNEIGYFMYYLQAGLSPGFCIRAKADETTSTQIGNNAISTSSESNVDIKDNINTFNLAMVIGGGLEYTLSGSTVLLAGITFNNGFLDVNSSADIKVNSNFLALSLGVLF